MTVILLKNTPIGRRAYAMSQDEADKMVSAGEAVQDRAHIGIYEEITEGEISQGYMTRTLEAINPASAKKRGRPPKVRHEVHTEEVPPSATETTEDEPL